MTLGFGHLAGQRATISALAVLLLTLPALSCAQQPLRPNILLIVADDLGYTDIGAYGSEIRTPTLDALAASGLSFTSFYAAPTCSPARAMLITGLDNHLAGFGTMAEHLAVNQRGQPGFEGYLTDDVVTLPDLLRDAGYRTYFAGKWHIGAGEGQRPHERGFDRSFALMQGGASHFADKARVTSAYPETLYYEDGVKVETLPEDFFSSAFYADRVIEYIDAERASDAPFYAQLAFTAVHWPLQAPPDYIDRYEGMYDEGYEVLRDRRFAGAQTAGLVPANVPVAPRLPRVAPWAELNAEQQRESTRAMEIYAAMVENMDFHIGRVLAYLRRTGQYDNTLIVFISDNGAEGNDRLLLEDNLTWVPANFDLSYENMGRENSYVQLGAGWAQATTTPLRLFKAYLTEGGIRVPAIMRLPGSERAGSFVRSPATIRDLMPTFLELAGTSHPGDAYRGRAVRAISGRSLVPVLAGEAEAVYGTDDVLGWELFGHRALRQGDWKVLWADGKNGSDDWQLFNLADDPREVVDLAAMYPEKLQSMIALWQEYAASNNVILPIGDIGNPN